MSRPVWEDLPQLARELGLDSTTARSSDDVERDMLLNYATQFWAEACAVPAYVPALVQCEHPEQALTYGVLLREVATLALRLRNEYNVRDGRVVCILMEKSVGYVVGLLATLCAGGSFVPLTPSDPPTVRSRVVEDCGVAVVLTGPGLELPGVPSLHMPEHVETRVSSAAEDARVIKEARELSYAIAPQQQACIVYSSGTTGHPKGICIPHLAMIACYLWRFTLTRPKRWGGSRVACNVFFVWECLRPFLRGATCVVIPDGIVFDPPALLRALKVNRVTEWLSTPSLMEAVLQTSSEEELAIAMRTLRVILFNGEVVRPELARRTLDSIRKSNEKIRLFNLYSISECHEVSITEISDELLLSLPPSSSAVPVGEVQPYQRAVVLKVGEDGEAIRDGDGNCVEVEEGEVGRLHVAGVGLAIGYHKLPEMTKKRFFTSHPHGRLYDTGDIARMNGRQIQVLGRGDSMVKIRGYSVVLGAVESMINRVLNVQQCCVVAKGAEGTDKRLVAYIVLDTEQRMKDWPVDPRTGACPEAHAALRHHLPLSHIPSCFVALSSLPVHEVSGKTNLRALPEPPARLEMEGGDSELGELSITSLRQLFAEIIGAPLEAVPEDGDFFALGGHSLLAAKLVSRLKRSEWASADLRVADVFTYPTPSMLLRFIAPEACATTTEEQKAESDALFVTDLEEMMQEVDKIYSESPPPPIAGVEVDGAMPGVLGAVLVTGGSGFVGATVVGRIKKEYPGQEVIQLIRASAKLREASATVVGDLSKPHLGLSSEEFAALQQRVGLVIHCAAAVNLVAKYSSLRLVNVCGTLELLRLRRPMRFVSSSAAHKEAKDGYGQSKYIAECMIRRAASNGAEATLVRPPDIAGPGMHIPLHDHRFMVLRSVVESGGLAPSIDGWRWRAQSVDDVVQCLLDGREDLPSPFVCSIHDVARWMRDEGYPFHVAQVAEATSGAETVLSVESWATRLPVDSQVRVLYQQGLLDILCSAFDPHEKSGEEVRPYSKERFALELASLRAASAFPSPLPLISHCAIVTGASSGIGAAITRRLLEGGARVLLASRRGIAPADAVRGFTEGIDYVCASCDVRDTDAVERAVQKCIGKLGAPTVIVNNAGVMYFSMMRNRRIDEWKQTVDTVCHGACNLLHAALPHLLSRKTPGMANIVSITSDAGRRPFAGLAVYSGAKHFVEAMTGAMRLEFAADPAAQHVRITNIQPGNVSTPLLSLSKDKEALDQYGQPTENCKVLEPDDVARAVVFAITQPSYCSVNEILVEPRLEPI